MFYACICAFSGCQQVVKHDKTQIHIQVVSRLTDKVENDSNSELAMYCQLQIVDNNNESGKPFSHFLIFVFCFSASSSENIHLCINPLRNWNYVGRGALLDTFFWNSINSMEQESTVNHCKQKEAANTILASVFYSTLKYT